MGTARGLKGVEHYHSRLRRRGSAGQKSKASSTPDKKHGCCSRSLCSRTRSVSRQPSTELDCRNSQVGTREIGVRQGHSTINGTSHGSCCLRRTDGSSTDPVQSVTLD